MSEEQQRAGERRSLLSRGTGLAMGATLLAAYGTLAAFMGRFLYPARPTRRDWMFVVEVERLPPGAALRYEMPDGGRLNIAHQGNGDRAEDFIALSSVCPHLGCQVHWEAQNDRFFCPCHNGIFDRSGVATAGPPAEAEQSLPRFPLRVASGLLYVEVPMERIARAEGRIVAFEGPPGPGHDPCLYAQRDRTEGTGA